jgi:hypothetical protein
VLAAKFHLLTTLKRRHDGGNDIDQLGVVATFYIGIHKVCGLNFCRVLRSSLDQPWLSTGAQPNNKQK